MYTPTKEELEELGFTKFESKEMQFIVWLHDYFEYLPSNNIFKGPGSTSSRFYPQSLEDIKTLIKLLTPIEK